MNPLHTETPLFESRTLNLGEQPTPGVDEITPTGVERTVETAADPPQLTDDELLEFSGNYFAPELDATYRFAVVEGDLVVRIEQEPPLRVTPVFDDEFEIRFSDQGLSGPQDAVLEFDRNRTGVVTWFGLSSGTERGIVFERR